MIDLTTNYLGLVLKNPLIASSSQLTSNLDDIKKLEDNGIAAVVMHSIFEEQINHEIHEIDHFLFRKNDSFSEATEFFPKDIEFDNIKSDDYLREIEEIKKSVNIPIIGSLNGVSTGGWIDYSTKLQEVGVDAIELNITYIPTDIDMNPREIEDMYVNTIKDLRQHIKIPLSLKMNRYFSNPAYMAKRFVDAGVDALTIFYNLTLVDIDLENLTTATKINLTSSVDLSETLRWCAILYNQLNVDLCANGGIHSGEDVLKALMSGAKATSFTSVLLQKDVGEIKNMLERIQNWMLEKEYKSVSQMIGSISLKHTDNPAAYERGSYMDALIAFRY